MTNPLDRTALERALEHVPLEPAERDAIARLEDGDLDRIDRAILATLGTTWQKAGFIASGVMIAAPDAYEDLPEAFYAARIRALVQAAGIEGRGDPDVLKTFEIRLPQKGH